MKRKLDRKTNPRRHLNRAYLHYHIFFLLLDRRVKRIFGISPAVNAAFQYFLSLFGKLDL